jgi:hypothetical protein
MLQIERRGETLLHCQWTENGRSTPVVLSQLTGGWMAQHCAQLDRTLRFQTPILLGEPLSPQSRLEAYFGTSESEILEDPWMRWRTASGPTAAASTHEFSCEADFKGIDAFLILRGMPIDGAEFKWRAAVEPRGNGGTLHVVRSMTNTPVWEWDFVRTEAGIAFRSARVNTDGQAYLRGRDGDECAALTAIVQQMLLPGSANTAAGKAAHGLGHDGDQSLSMPDRPQLHPYAAAKLRRHGSEVDRLLRDMHDQDHEFGQTSPTWAISFDAADLVWAVLMSFGLKQDNRDIRNEIAQQIRTILEPYAPMLDRQAGGHDGK